MLAFYACPRAVEQHMLRFLARGIEHVYGTGDTIYRCQSSQHFSASSFACFLMITIRRIFMSSIRGSWRRSISLAVLIAGEIRSARARRLVRDWARLHELELRLNWKKLKALQPIRQIAPLE